MKNYELLGILRSFSPGETAKFEKFLISPYFNNRRKIVLLYKEIVKYYPLFTHVNLSKRKLFKRVFPKAAYNDSTMRNLLSDLQESAMNFLSIENFERSKLDKSNFLFHELSIKGLHNEFWKTLEKTNELRDGLVDWTYFLNNHFTEANKYNFSHHYSKLHKETDLKKEISYLNNSVNNLVYFFVMNFTSIYLNYLTYKKSYNTYAAMHNNIEKLFSMMNFRELKELMQNDKNSFVIEIYSALIKLFADPESDENYYAFKKVFFSNISGLSKDERSFLYYQLITFSYLRLEAPVKGLDYEKELFTLFVEMLDKEYFLDRNTHHLPHELYRNILSHSLRMKNFAWAHEFIEKYSFRVHPSDKENMYNYGYAYLMYELGKYEDALLYLQKVEKEYFVYKIDVKNLLLKIFYELGYTEESLSLLKTHILSLRRNRLIEAERKKRYINFSKFLEKLVYHKAGTLRQDIGYIKHRLQRNEEVAFKPWLLEKIAECQAKPAKFRNMDRAV